MRLVSLWEVSDSDFPPYKRQDAFCYLNFSFKPFDYLLIYIYIDMYIR